MHSSDVLQQIRATRPTAPTALRERVRAMAAEPRPEAPRPMRVQLPSLRRFVLVAAPAALVIALGTAGVLGLARSGQPAQSGETLSAVAQDKAAPTTTPSASRALEAPPGATESATGAPSVVAPTPGRLQRYEAYLRLRVDGTEDLSRATQRALRLTREYGGYVVSAQTSTPERGRGSAELVVRIPRTRVQQAVVSFSELGTILAQQVHVEDLQAQVDDLSERIAQLVGENARIRKQLENPNLPAETRARLSAQLAENRRQLAELRTTKQQTTREGTLATVSLSLTTEKQAAAPPAPSRIDRALDKAGTVLAWEAAVVLVALVTLGPLLLLGALVWFAVRFARRRSEERLLERA
jgi:Domain of unknown function (DUF4349)